MQNAFVLKDKKNVRFDLDHAARLMCFGTTSPDMRDVRHDGREYLGAGSDVFANFVPVVFVEFQTFQQQHSFLIRPLPATINTMGITRVRFGLG